VKGIGLLLALVVVAGGVGLVWAHASIRRERAALPAPAVVDAALAVDDAPVRLSVVNTASQPMPRSAVLEAGRDPTPDAPYVMSHPAFVLEWSDGRILLVDSGMTREGAESFGKPLEWLAGAQPIVPHGSAAEQLGDARARVGAVVFTHLHPDHVGGITALCEGRTTPIRVFLNEAQDARPNYTTRSGRRLLADTDCVQIETLPGAGPITLPGFPGVALIPVGGHTPGSQVVVATVGAGAAGTRWVFTGDSVNALDGLRNDVPKPFLYRLLMVPEDETRQEEVRRFLRDLTETGYRPLVAHDRRAIEASGVPAWPHPRSEASSALRAAVIGPPAAPGGTTITKRS
jgi:glyoxylase-like metal-dependent hydrolase (beta-lactamase superfamily II)